MQRIFSWKNSFLFLLTLIVGVAFIVFLPHPSKAQILPPLGAAGYYTSFDMNRDNGGNAKDLGGDGAAVVPVISLSQLPAGNYLITVNADVSGVGSCSLDPNAFDSSSILPWYADLNTPNVHFTEALKLTQKRDVTLYCQWDGEDLMQEVKTGISAIKLNSLTIIP